MKLNEMKIKLGEKIVESPRLLKEEKLEILACIKEEKNSEILESLLHEYEINEQQIGPSTPDLDRASSHSFSGRGTAGIYMIHTIAKYRAKGCIKRAKNIRDPKERNKAIKSCNDKYQKIKDYV